MSLSSSHRITLAEPIPSDPPRFIVGGQTGSASGDVKMYEWQRTRGEMRLLGLQTDVGQIRTMKWSPLPTHKHLIAVGLSTGRSLLMSLSPDTLAFPLNGNNSVNPLPTSTVAMLPIKYARSVSAMAFSPTDPNYLATGYERHRSDYSLLIWDLETSISAIPPDRSGTPWTRPNDRLETINPHAKDPAKSSNELRPIQQYCASEHVNDITFLPKSFNILVSANNKAVRLFDLRAPSPGQTPESSTIVSTMQWTTRAVSDLSPDPTNPTRFASYESSSSGSTVRLWDMRKAGSEVLGLDVSGAILGIEWAPGAGGVSRLGVGTKDGVSVWDIINGRTVDEAGMHEWTSLGEMKHVVRPRQNLQSFAFSHCPDKGRSDILFVVKDGTIGVGGLSSAPAIASGARGDTAVVSGDLITVEPRIEGEPLAAEMSSEPDSDDEVNTVTRANRFQLQPARVTTILAEAAANSRSASPAPSSLLKGTNFGGRVRTVDPGDEEMGDGRHQAGGDEDLTWSSWQNRLRHEIGWTMQRRAAEGYGLSNLLLNAAIATKYTGSERLAGVWEFVAHLTKVMNPKTANEGPVSLAFAGIHPIWSGQDLNPPPTDSPTSSIRSHATLIDDGSEDRVPSRVSTPREPVKSGSAAWTHLRNTQHQLPSRSKTTPVPSLGGPSGRYDSIIDQDFTTAVETINKRRHDTDPSPRFPVSGQKTAQRRLILSICGEMGPNEIDRLVAEGHRTKASCLAYFSGEEEYAVRMLLQSPNSKHRLLGTTLAGFLSQAHSTRGSSSSFFDEHWRTLVNRVDDPYIRAILSKIAGDGFESVLEEEAMPLLDRISIAVNNLSDQDLDAFLTDRVKRFIRNSFPTFNNFIALLGFTSLSIVGLQRWLERTGDIQTTAILSCFFPSARLSPGEREIIRRWVEAYRSLLDQWGMWGARVDFDVRRMEIGKSLGEERQTEEDIGTSKGLCPVCSNALSKAHEEHLQAAPKNKVHPSERQANCTFCGQALPRCVICLRHVEPSHQDEYDEWIDVGDTIDQAYVCCLTCRHGGHANHILPWFDNVEEGGGHAVCPVSGCDCHCADI